MNDRCLWGALPGIVAQHAEEASFLWQQRAATIRFAHPALEKLAEHDERLAAHFDGLNVAGELGARMLEERLALDEPGALFAATVLALTVRDLARVEKLVRIAISTAAARRIVTEAFGWVEPSSLRGIVSGLLRHSEPGGRQIAIAACGLHRVDPGPVLVWAFEAADPALRSCALQCSAELGRSDCIGACLEHLDDDDSECRFSAAKAAVLLGEREKGLAALAGIACGDGPLAVSALELALIAGDKRFAQAFRSRLSSSADAAFRTVVMSAGYEGDPARVPWLVDLMSQPAQARAAGEALGLVTGLDVVDTGLEAAQPNPRLEGATDDPEDDNVAMDEDDGLPWPDQAKVAAWWRENSRRFLPGQRFFVGKPPGTEHCLHVLKEGYQRQRQAAAIWRCILQPGTPLFPTQAPAWRQQRLLTQLKR